MHLRLHVYLIIQSKLLTKSPNGTISRISIGKRLCLITCYEKDFFLRLQEGGGEGGRIGLCGQMFSSPVFTVIDKYP